MQLQLFFFSRRVVKKMQCNKTNKFAELRDVSQAFACSERESSFVKKMQAFFFPRGVGKKKNAPNCRAARRVTACLLRDSSGVVRGLRGQLVAFQEKLCEVLALVA
jgi:hypothetical protein